MAVARWTARGPRTVGALLLLSVAAGAQPRVPQPPFALGPATVVADGVELFRPDARGVMDPPGPVAVQALRIDPTRARLALALANDATPSRQTVSAIASAHRAVAAVNASFFDAIGRQTGLTKVAGTVVSTTARARGAVAWSNGRPLTFDRVRLRMAVGRPASRMKPVPVDHVNPTARRSGLSLFTLAFRLTIPGRSGGLLEPDAPAGAPTSREPPPLTSAEPAASDEPSAARPDVRVWRWKLQESETRVARVLRDGDERWHTHGGPVLMFRSATSSPPRTLRGLQPGSRVELLESYERLLGSPIDAWPDAEYAVGGAGLLVYAGRHLDDWSPEQLRTGFTTERHPRTMVGTDEQGRTWLITVDGRRPDLSVGMSFAELQRLARAIGLVNALNLDGGGSTTMVVRGTIVNHPSDPLGARPVPDAIVVLPERPAGPGGSRAQPE